MSQFNSLHSELDESLSCILKSFTQLGEKKASARVKMLMMGKFSPFPCLLTTQTAPFTCRRYFSHGWLEFRINFPSSEVSNAERRKMREAQCDEYGVSTQPQMPDLDQIVV